MTQKQINRYHTIMSTIEGNMRVSEAAVALGMSERQVTRLRKGVKEEGAAFLIHKSKGRASPKAITEEVKAHVVELYRSQVYVGANFLHFQELLEEHEGITLSYSVVRKILVEAGLESPKKRRRFKPHHRRKRKPQEGLLTQLDATPFEWFGGKTKFALHGAIDDATSKIVGLHMTKNECLHGYFETIRSVIEENGVPVGVYADRHTIFRSPKADALTVEEQLSGKTAADTQFGRAMKELGITLIAARSPQAKGRIERLWDTLQSRLVIEFRIHNIKNEHEANAFLKDYIPKYNAAFSVAPEESERAYVPCHLDLELILCVKERRVVDNGGMFSFHGKLFKVCGDRIPGKAKVEVIASATRGILALHNGVLLDVLPHIKPRKTDPPAKEHRPYIPPENHYYKRGKPAIPLFSSDCIDQEVFKMLKDIFLSKYA